VFRDLVDKGSVPLSHALRDVCVQEYVVKEELAVLATQIVQLVKVLILIRLKAVV
jgi:hypothetical protein